MALPEPTTPHFDIHVKIVPEADGKVTFMYEGFRIEDGQPQEIDHTAVVFHACEFIKHMAIRGEQKTGKQMKSKKVN